MILIFILLLLISAGVFIILLMLINSNKTTARNIEIFGYFLLVVSLIWTSVFNITDEMAKDSEFMMLDETLKVMWFFEGDKRDYLIDGDIDKLNDEYERLTKYFQGQVFNNETINEQKAITNKIHYGLFVFSSLFIAAGRLSEVLNVNKKKKSSTNKIKKKKTYKRRNKRK